MSDEEEEAFSASEDEWKPSKERGGESSDDDDSDFEEVGATATGAAGGASRKRESEPKAGRGGGSSGGGAAKTKGSAAKKRKPTGQSLRTKLYNKYRPPPKTFLSPTNSGGTAGSNSPSASTSRTASKNAKTPNEGNGTRNGGDGAGDSSSECSVDDYLVDPAELDLQSSFFNPSEGVGGGGGGGGGDRSRDHTAAPAPPTAPPVFDCNAGLGHLSDSGSEDNNDSSADERANTKAFDFRNLLEKANSLERAKETIAKRAAEAKTEMKTGTVAAGKGGAAAADKRSAAAATDISSLLALGEKPKTKPPINKKQQPRQHKHGNKHNDNDDDEEEDDDDDDDDGGGVETTAPPQRLSKTKSTRVKRHTRIRPVSKVMLAGDSDDSDFEEVADEHSSATAATSFDSSSNNNNTSATAAQQLNGSLEIHVELPTRQRTKQTRSQQELELAFKRKLNRDLKDRQLLLHKTTLLCGLARNYTYNRLLNDTALMQAVLKLLPNQNVYPPASGTSAKYFQSFVKWYGGDGVMRLTRTELYPPKRGVTKRHVRQELLAQVQRKEAHSQQDYVMLFVALVRAMGLQCRVVVNLQPLPLRPPQSDLVPIKLNAEPPAPTKPVGKAVKVAASPPSSPPPAAVAVTTKAPPPKPARKALPPPKAQESTTIEAHSHDQPSTSRSRKVAEKKETKQQKAEVAAAPAIKTHAEAKPNLSRLKRELAPLADSDVPAKVAKTKAVAVKVQRVKPEVAVGSPKVPTIIVAASSTDVANKRPARTTATVAAATKAKKAPAASQTRGTRSRSRSVSPAVHVDAAFLQTTAYKRKFGVTEAAPATARAKSKSPTTHAKVHVCADFLRAAPAATKRVLRQRQKTNEATHTLGVPQLDGADDAAATVKGGHKPRAAAPQLRKLRGAKKTTAATVEISDDEAVPSSSAMSDEDFVPSPPKRPRKAPVLPATAKPKDRRVLSSDDEDVTGAGAALNSSKKSKDHNAIDIWAEVYSDVEQCWLSVDLFKMKVDAVDAVRRAASSSLAYVFAYQNDLSLKDVTARYCPHWTRVVRKDRVDKAWLDAAIGGYLARRTARDRREDLELRRIHEEKPLPTTISDFKNHPLYALERHLLKFQGIYPPDAPPINYIRGEPIYARDCVHLLHSRDIWLKQARTVKLGEKPYKVVKARPKWDRLTQTVIKDQPLEIFGYWQTQDYEPPTAENGIVPRNAYGNVELFKECMLPKKTVHLKLSGLNRICKKLGIDCANAVIGFDFHQGACHPMYDGFVVCEEFNEVVVAAWHQDQEEQERKEIEKRDQRIWGNWKKLIRGLLIRERLKKKYNF